MENKTDTKLYFKGILNKKGLLTSGELEELFKLLLPYKKPESKVLNIRIEKNRYGKNHFV